jgi:PAS domain S-box-containing protein
MYNGKTIGALTVCYTEGSERAPVSFTREEKKLLTSITPFLLQLIIQKEKNTHLRIFEEVVTQAPVLIVITDADGKIVYMNDAITKEMGYTLDELGGTIKTFFPVSPEGLKTIQEISEANKRNQVWQGELEVETKDGRFICIRGMVATAMTEESKLLRLVIFYDVTREVHLRELQCDQTEKYKTVFDNIPIGISIIDKNGKLLFTNPFVRQLFAPGRAEQENLTVFDVLPRGAAEQAIPNISWIIENKVPIRSENHILLTDKEFYLGINRLPLFDDRGNVTSVLYLTSDITDRKHQEQLIQIIHNVDSLSNLTTTLNESLEMISLHLMQLAWVDGLGIYLFNESHDTLELVYVKGFKEKFINHVARYPSEGLYVNRLMKRMATFFKTSDLQDPIRAYMQEEGLVFGSYIPLVYQDKVIGSLNLGSRKVEVIDEFNRDIVESIAARLANLIMLVKTRSQLAETTIELKRHLNELITKQQMLIQKSRLESLGELSAGLAHEINQPLSIITLIMENILNKMNKGQVSKTYLQRKFLNIQQSVDKIATLIEHIRMFSRDHVITSFDRIDVNKTIHETLTMIGTQLKNRHIKIDLDLCDGACYTYGNASRFEQVILNLLTNARDAIEQKQKQVSHTEYSREIRITARPADEFIKITIWDSGTGISPEHIDKVFDPFFTTKEKGTGLGLPIVYGIVQEMNGEIRAQSHFGEYTEIIIKLPLFRPILNNQPQS